MERKHFRVVYPPRKSPLLWLMGPRPWGAHPIHLQGRKAGRRIGSPGRQGVGKEARLRVTKGTRDRVGPEVGEGSGRSRDCRTSTRSCLRAPRTTGVMGIISSALPPTSSVTLGWPCPLPEFPFLFCDLGTIDAHLLGSWEDDGSQKAGTIVSYSPLPNEVGLTPLHPAPPTPGDPKLPLEL